MSFNVVIKVPSAQQSVFQENCMYLVKSKCKNSSQQLHLVTIPSFKVGGYSEGKGVIWFSHESMLATGEILNSSLDFLEENYDLIKQVSTITVE